MKKDYELSVVVPAYNEIKNLLLLIQRYKKAKKNIRFQLVIVNNGSSDGTGEYLGRECAKKENSFIKIVTVPKNIGYGNGIHKGLRACDAEVIGWSHADLQCSPDDVFQGYVLYKKLNNKYVFIKGHRQGRDWKSLILAYGLAFCSSIVLLKIFDDINGQPKIFNKELLSKFENPPKGFSYDLYTQYKALTKRYKVYCFKVVFEKRIFGVSKWAYSVYSKFSTIKSFIKDVVKIRLGMLK